MALQLSSHQNHQKKQSGQIKGQTFYEWVCVTHRASEELLLMGNWALFILVTFGLLFSLTIVPLTFALNAPVQTLQLQASVINHLDMAAEPYFSVASDPQASKDPDWDGAVEGGIMGLHYGQQLPVVGMPLGLALGLWAGFKLDQAF